MNLRTILLWAHTSNDMAQPTHEKYLHFLVFMFCQIKLRVLEFEMQHM